MITGLHALSIALVISLCIIERILKYIKDIENNKDDTKLEIKKLKNENAILRNYCKTLIENFEKSKESNSSNIADSDIIEAIKYARQKAHPDNGGNNEDFMKFNELYKKYAK